MVRVSKESDRYAILPRKWDTFFKKTENKALLFQFNANDVRLKIFPGLREKKVIT